MWTGPETVFVWADREQPKELAGLKAFPLARSGGKFVFTNRDLRLRSLESLIARH